ncbi:predicted protein [Sclerotinia sclerotiorum 1980 UF-70]|uniref:Uncharacterized protein n=1 Tax=Sclerotinia sclerotiorum (strain ATCC 18683 / 1980 / Ss-1) TaxID=665079 RepID=A7EHQ6_SCLS1|nr:predicted protein [Sclerotinia sclerotiorum 1980 UF-70]EDO02372.1 predicted protein [Sclerotinia sclerotiorum 1980 UF-70]
MAQMVLHYNRYEDVEGRVVIVLLLSCGYHSQFVWGVKQHFGYEVLNRGKLAGDEIFKGMTVEMDHYMIILINCEIFS